MIKNIVIVIITILLVLSIYGLLFKPSNKSIILNERKGNLRKFCNSNTTECNKDDDCKLLCEESKYEDMMCTDLNRYSENQEVYGKQIKVCLPKKAVAKCDEKHGGLKVWTGWSNPVNMEWDCLCSYPNYFSNNYCDKLNSGICQGGVFNWDVTSKEAPNFTNCSCASDHILMKNKIDESPACVSKSMKSWYDDLYETI